MPRPGDCSRLSASCTCLPPSLASCHLHAMQNKKKAVSEEALNPSTLPSCCAEPAMATMLSSCLALQVGRETQAVSVEGTKQ